jgi:flagellar motor component MotA
MLVDGLEPEVIRERMELEIAEIEEILDNCRRNYTSFWSCRSGYGSYTGT